MILSPSESLQSQLRIGSERGRVNVAEVSGVCGQSISGSLMVMGALVAAVG